MYYIVTKPRTATESRQNTRGWRGIGGYTWWECTNIFKLGQCSIWFDLPVRPLTFPTQQPILAWQMLRRDCCIAPVRVFSRTPDVCATDWIWSQNHRHTWKNRERRVVGVGTHSGCAFFVVQLLFPCIIADLAHLFFYSMFSYIFQYKPTNSLRCMLWMKSLALRKQSEVRIGD